MVDAIPALESEKAVRLFEKFNIFTKSELAARTEIDYESYLKDILIEARTMVHMAAGLYIPAMIRYAGELAEAAVNVRNALGTEEGAEVEKELLRELNGYLKETREAEKALRALIREESSVENEREKAQFCRDRIVPAMEALRAPVDAAERITRKDVWPVPTYADLMFEV